MQAAKQTQSRSLVDVAGRRLVLFGAIGRHNFGDLLMAEVAAALIQRYSSKHQFALPPPIFADILPADMRGYGGQRVHSISRLFGGNVTTDLVLVGGDVLGVPLSVALLMSKGSAQQQAALNRVMPAIGSAYVLPTTRFRRPGIFVANAIGGLPRDSDLETLAQYDHASARSPVRSLPLVADSVVLLRVLLGHKVDAQRSAPAQQAVRRTMSGRPYWAVQLKMSFSEQYISNLAVQLCTSSHQYYQHAGGRVGLVLFRAGAANGHDNLHTLQHLRKELARVGEVNGACMLHSVLVYEALHIFGICALIAEAALLVASSLHCRIIAVNYHVPRVTIDVFPSHSWPKYRQFIHYWDDPKATIVELSERRQSRVPVPQCIGAGHAKDCGGVIAIQGVSRAIGSTLEAREMADWQTRSLEQCAALVDSQRNSSSQWLRMLRAHSSPLIHRSNERAASEAAPWGLLLSATTNVKVDLRRTGYGLRQQRNVSERQQMYSEVLAHWLGAYPKLPVALAENSGDSLAWTWTDATKGARLERLRIEPASSCSGKEIGCHEADAILRAVRTSRFFRAHGQHKQRLCTHALKVTGRYAVTSDVDAALRGCARGWDLALQNTTWGGTPVRGMHGTQVLGFRVALAEDLFGWSQLGEMCQECHVHTWLRKHPAARVCHLPALSVKPVRMGSTGILVSTV